MSYTDFFGSMRHSILTVTPTSTTSSTTDERSKSRAKTCLVMHCKEEEDRRSTTRQDARQLRASLICSSTMWRTNPSGMPTTRMSTTIWWGRNERHLNDIIKTKTSSFGAKTAQMHWNLISNPHFFVKTCLILNYYPYFCIVLMYC